MEKESLARKLDDLSLKTGEKNAVLGDKHAKISVLQSHLKEVNSQIDALTSVNVRYNSIKENSIIGIDSFQESKMILKLQSLGWSKKLR